jgi:uncharacterized protein (DUF302 family)
MLRHDVGYTAIKEIVDMATFIAPIGAIALTACWIAATSALAGDSAAPAASDGVVTVRSAFSTTETIERVKRAVSDKGIMFFGAVDQARLGADAGIQVHSSTLLMFGNPPLGIQFLTANPLAGLDWPVRLLVIEDEKGQVWTAYTDFTWIARRHHIANRDEAFKMATKVVDSINDSIRAP